MTVKLVDDALIVRAHQGLVLVDGKSSGIAITMTPNAAMSTSVALREMAELAIGQQERDDVARPIPRAL